MSIKHLAISALALSMTYFTFAESDTQTEARSNAMLLGKTLKAELQAAKEAGGPKAAISVCNIKALPLSAEISKQTGWSVNRTSLKVRNPANQPTEWETEQMELFNQRLAAGEPVAQLEVFSEGKTADGKIVQHFMKAIPTEEGCLACHGDNIAAPVAAKLTELYPNDQARGFKAGELRGAFTLTRVLN